MRKDPTFAPKTLAPLDVLGVQGFTASAEVIRIRIMAVPSDQWGIARELRRRIKTRFDTEGITLSLPHLSMYLANGGPPVEVTLRKPSSGHDGQHRDPGSQ